MHFSIAERSSGRSVRVIMRSIARIKSDGLRVSRDPAGERRLRSAAGILRDACHAPVTHDLPHQRRRILPSEATVQQRHNHVAIARQVRARVLLRGAHAVPERSGQLAHVEREHLGVSQPRKDLVRLLQQRMDRASGLRAAPGRQE